MSRPLIPIAESLAGELYDYFLDFIDDHNAIPVERAFWGWLIQTQKYSLQALPVSKFNYHFGRLMREGYITVEPKTRALIPRERRIVPLENISKTTE